MRTPDLIKKDIEILKKELEQSKKHYEFELISSDEEQIGFFNIGLTKKVLQLLKEGNRLEYRHGVYGKYSVFMNENGNRVLVTNTDSTNLEWGAYNKFENYGSILVYKSPINENTILSFLIWNRGKWYLKR